MKKFFFSILCAMTIIVSYAQEDMKSEFVPEHQKQLQLAEDKHAEAKVTTNEIERDITILENEIENLEIEINRKNEELSKIQAQLDEKEKALKQAESLEKETKSSLREAKKIHRRKEKELRE